MFFKVLTKGFLGSNTYVLGKNGEGVVIDPGNSADDIFSLAIENGIKIKYIFLTHAHYDHMIYLDQLKYKTNAKVVVHELDADGFTDPKFNVSSIFGVKKTFNPPDVLTKEGDVFDIGKMKFEIIHTPGHTPGGICILSGDMLFTGDTVFDGDFGRTDLGHGSEEDLLASVKRIFTMDPDLMVYPGHDSSARLSDIVMKCRTGFGYYG